MGPRVTTTQEVSASADIPYQNVLIVALFSSFDTRKSFEQEVAQRLSRLGGQGVASTSLMTTTTPLTRQTFLAMVEDIDADAVLITQPVTVESQAAMRDMRPEQTINFTPSYYYNVWSVEQTEYVEPQSLEIEQSLVLATQMYSVSNQAAVWAIESKSKIVRGEGSFSYFPYIVNEADAIAANLSENGLIAQ